MSASRHPIQPLLLTNNIIRFKPNAIVQHLLDHGGIDLNQLACLDFPREDREQFAQLIGYSHSGFSSLGYASAEVIDASWATYNEGTSELQARYDALLALVRDICPQLRHVASALFEKHPDDLVSSYEVDA